MRQTSNHVSPFSNEARNTYVLAHITDALLQLLQDRPIGDISICELCELAGIGRASFYRNFESKEDILRARIRSHIRSWTEGQKPGEGTTLSQWIQVIFTNLEDNRDFYSLLSRRGLLDLLKDVLLEICGPTPKQPPMDAYARAYVVYTLYGWIATWFLRDMQESAEDLTALFKSHGL